MIKCNNLTFSALAFWTGLLKSMIYMRSKGRKFSASGLLATLCLLHEKIHVINKQWKSIMLKKRPDFGHLPVGGICFKQRH